MLEKTFIIYADDLNYRLCNIIHLDIIKLSNLSEINIIIADDHTVVLELLKELVESNIDHSVVYAVTDYAGIIGKLNTKMKFDLVIMDYKMPGVKSMASIKWILNTYHSQRLAIMSGSANISEIHEFIDIGVDGFFPKTIRPQALISAISLILNGEKYIPTILYEKQFPTENAQATPRELEVLSKLHLGYSNKQIANALDLKEVTIKMYVSKLCDKFNAANRTQLVVKALDFGILQ